MDAAPRRDGEADESDTASADTAVEEDVRDEAVRQAMSRATKIKTPEIVAEELGRTRRSAPDRRAPLRRYEADAARGDDGRGIPNRRFIRSRGTVRRQVPFDDGLKGHPVGDPHGRCSGTKRAGSGFGTPKTAPRTRLAPARPERRPHRIESVYGILAAMISSRRNFGVHTPTT